jgi:hypothetical protein
VTVRQPRYSEDEFARRGDDIYEREVRAQVELAHKGEFVAIDIDSGDWELNADALAACDRLMERRPDSQTWLIRVGYPYVHRIGGHRQPMTLR